MRKRLKPITAELPIRASRKEILMRRLFFCVLALFLLLSSLTCFSQQTDIRQFSTFQAFSYLTTPSLNLSPARIRWRLWLQLEKLANVGF